MKDFPQTLRNRVRRIPERGNYSKDTIYPILDAASICHVGYVEEGQPYVIPTLHGRIEDTIYLHGAKASRTIKESASGIPLCLTVSLIDGIVAARSLMHSSLNYRSVVVFGTGRMVTEPEEKIRALEAITEQIIPGRWNEARKPNEKELNATNVAAVSIESASAKVRNGPPIDDEEDYSLPIWAGVVPFSNRMGPPVPDSRLGEGIQIPESIRRLSS
ncbi:MAG: pyridoxamine 5'-phosphate oxidase family protein [SAR324 cluster bacterium]|jgi:hypothetical protein|nr:flavin-nucleotide-binding protein [Deltaproteobacteria bacterium]MDP6091221.1 pyridoxamine 5'-phosphate oxidase family protein [SAR324 cluster bacterium]MBI14200.1 flavin-nucleotide-binding protein [Deltaproteobacteria bacterium]MDP6248854.1 pyridoxamine 5'-phosphate oxidase family protein [SAR324 cluster bacterium]MDP6464519.1 pyridoxamine 5'-phosphate oxidase family protein [SAR324 cluster bacterium]|tara:strand:+ start:1076 stop:1726 length:651 start_codon:yes stop_codon:yes gene_type:complete